MTALTEGPPPVTQTHPDLYDPGTKNLFSLCLPPPWVKKSWEGREFYEKMSKPTKGEASTV